MVHAPSLLDKLLGHAGDGGAAAGTLPRWPLERIKQALARDLEGLLNTRSAWTAERLQGRPRVARSVLALGMADVGTECADSDHSRRRIAERIRQTLVAHERRLAEVVVGVRRGADRRLVFTIEARLRLQAAVEPVRFDAELLAGTQRYAVVPAAGGRFGC
ncbi:hypothetical protein CKO43_21905 [Rubrivivax gelatinosus]|uniref:IraD/Gp25-like domain-containing protein n=1 Tax=Rubrivivax gelatinosus TaxID=28068 RepID=A0ABS1E0W9_RUBGE|nr:hypothetical protein [Rubrivivax gelatinosus]